MFQFLRYRIPSALLSSMVIVAGCVAYVYNGGFRYSVDFTGGTEVRIRFEKPENTAQIQTAIADEWSGTVYNIIGDNEIIVRVQHSPQDVKNLDKKIEETVNKASVDNPGTVIQTNSISNSVGQTLRYKSVQAILIALLAMLLYIAIRFQFAFAFGAVVAIFHDTLAILACFLLLNREISIDVIGAILATLGYSINDTIVIFTRIRENMKKHKGESLPTIINKSINETLRRTLLTSLSTGLVVGSQFIFGGDTIRDLSLALLLGIIFGTYSSIFIASSVMLAVQKEK